MFIQNVNKDDIYIYRKNRKANIFLLKLEFCNIFLKNSKFNLATSIQLFEVFVISYWLK